MRRPPWPGGVLTAALITQIAPAVTAIAPLRRRLLPGLAGISGGHRIALTYDDGPDPYSTPAFLDLLDRYDVRATFFLLGAFVWPNSRLVAEMASRGHELAVHGWDHQCLAWKRPGRLVGELGRTRQIVEDVSNTAVRCYRPPYGVLTTEGLVAARHTGLRPVLWSAWGADWSRRATPQSVATRVERVVSSGGTVLLHDTDRTSAPGSWRTTLKATERLLAGWAEQGTTVGPLRDHRLSRC